MGSREAERSAELNALIVAVAVSSLSVVHLVTQTYIMILHYLNHAL